MSLKSVNPATGETIQTYESTSDADIDKALTQAESYCASLKRTDFASRAEKMRKAADILEQDKDHWAKLMTSEMGKTITAARAEAEKCAWACRFYADNAESFLADEAIEADKSKSFVRHLPLGPVLAVMPWNFPFWQVIRFAAPALMAGNAGVLKHASNVSGCALAIEEIFKKAGFEDGAFTTLLIGSDRVERVLKDDRIKAATLTGSEPAGSAVAGTAGAEIKKTVLELGGSDAFIVMPSADLEKAAEIGVKARTINNGQSCIASKRFIVHEDVYEDYKALFLEKLQALKVGDPMDGDTDIGPLVSEKAREDIHAQVFDSIEAGAVRTWGAEVMDGPGAFYRPGILEEISPGSPAYDDEIFAPVALFFRAVNLDRAIALANDHRYGLSSVIWTKDEAEQEQAIERLQAGATFINDMTASDPRLPFGGVKKSGYGRELAQDGIREFVNRKTVAAS